jgi:hypothetical protein
VRADKGVGPPTGKGASTEESHPVGDPLSASAGAFFVFQAYWMDVGACQAGRRLHITLNGKWLEYKTF